MENKEKQITDEQKNPKVQDRNIEPAGESLAEAELEKVAGGKSYFESRSNISSAAPTAPSGKTGGTNPL